MVTALTSPCNAAESCPNLDDGRCSSIIRTFSYVTKRPKLPDMKPLVHQPQGKYDREYQASPRKQQQQQRRRMGDSTMVYDLKLR